MKTIFSHWKTTCTGVTMIAGAAWTLWNDRSHLDQTTFVMCIGAIMTGLGFVFSADGSQTSTPPAPGGTSKAGGPLLLLAAIMSASILCGCAPLAPGSRAIVVRAEQSITVANSTFDTAVHIDDANRSFWRTNLPAFHQFCEWLRAPVVIAPLTNSFPRGLAIVRSADLVKNEYKSSNSTNDYAALINSLAIVESATTQAQQFIAQTATSTVK